MLGYSRRCSTSCLAALGARFFPFMESAKLNSAACRYGVVKLKNVSFPCFAFPFFLYPWNSVNL